MQSDTNKRLTVSNLLFLLDSDYVFLPMEYHGFTSFQQKMTHWLTMQERVDKYKNASFPCISVHMHHAGGHYESDLKNLLISTDRAGLEKSWVGQETLLCQWLENVGGCCNVFLIAIGFPLRRSKLLLLRLQALPARATVFKASDCRRKRGHKMR